MIPWFHVPTLEGSLVRLESLSFNHAEDLAVAAEENRSSYDFTLVPRADEVGAYVAAQFERAEQGLIRSSDPPGGWSRCGLYRVWDLVTGLTAAGFAPSKSGFTWLAASAQGSGINAEAKLLLMTHAFEELQVARVDLKTDCRSPTPASHPAAI